VKKVFGSDGFRCKFGTEFMTIKFLTNFAESIAKFYIESKLEYPVLIGRDTRSSGVVIENLLTSILSYRGINVHCAGTLPSPGLSALLKANNFSIGVMITASHNNHTDNGIKLFAQSGFKLDEATESKINSYMLNSDNLTDTSDRLGEIVYLDNCFEEYFNLVSKDTIQKSTLGKLIIDCSNGALSKLSDYYAKNQDIQFINAKPNGLNINLNCGVLNTKLLLSEVRSRGYRFGLAFDGDGDRVVFVSNSYGIIETEKLVCLFFLMLIEKNNNRNNLVVTTEISNFSLRKNLANLGGELVEVEVGDRFVVQEVEKNNALFGCEPSGHYYFPKETKSMDGFVTALKFIELVSFYDNLEEKLESLTQSIRVQKNIPFIKSEEINLDSIKAELSYLIDPVNEKLTIRKSMWEPVFRVYYDYIGSNNFETVENRLKELLLEGRR